MAKSARRHHRVAKREAEQHLEEGLVITTSSVPKFIFFTIAVIMLIFVKGMIIGGIIGKKIGCGENIE